MKRLTICIDFDGTIVRDMYPGIGPLLPHAKEALQKFKDAGHTIIISSCRCSWHAAAAKAFLDEQQIPYDYFNQNDPERIKKYGGEDPRKISADLYIDDKNYLGYPVDWDRIYCFVTLYAQDGYTPAVEVKL